MTRSPHIDAEPDESRHGGGWRVRTSIAGELEVAIDFARQGPAMLPPDLIDLVTAIPPMWVDEFNQFGMTTPASASEGPYTFEYLARWADVAEVEDYDTASAAMRHVALDDAIRRVMETSGLAPNVDLDPTEQLIDLELQLFVQLVPQMGLYAPSDKAVIEQQRVDILAAINVLRGAAHHGRFWQWIDRFYHEAYQPWRLTRLDFIASLEQVAIEGLGSSEGTGLPNLDWLPPDNILIAIPEVGHAAMAGTFEVVFWAEPFGLGSALVLAPGTLITSFAEHGIDHDYSTAIRDDLTSKLKALSDPTRMSILRMIRMIDADNTQIAGYLNVSRPAVSMHAKTLASAGLISTTRAGRQARHAFHPDALRQLCAELLNYLDVQKGNE
jgi:DNA-binding transcriptional ArsR family regulator